MNTKTQTEIIVTETTSGKALPEGVKALSDAQLKDIVDAAFQRGKGEAPKKTQAELEAEKVRNEIQARLSSRVRRDMRNDASVGVGLRTHMDNGFMGGAALRALGFENEGNQHINEAISARTAIRAGLRESGATGTIRTAMSYIPLIGDVFLGGAGIADRALYTQQNAAATAAEGAAEINEALVSIAPYIGGLLAAKSSESAAATEHHKALTALDRGRTAAGLHEAEIAAVKTEAELKRAEGKRDDAKGALNAAQAVLVTAQGAKPVNTQAVSDAEREVAKATGSLKHREIELDAARDAHSRARKVVTAYGG